jgi:uncharacterized protein (DUF2384 family)
MKTNALRKKEAHAENQSPNYDLPPTYKCRWVKEILGLNENEMSTALNISYRTLANWLNDENDAAAMENVRFHRLLTLIEKANGLIKAEGLSRWIHRPKKDLGEMVPVFLLPDNEGYKRVIAILDDLGSGVVD